MAKTPRLHCYRVCIHSQAFTAATWNSLICNERRWQSLKANNWSLDCESFSKRNIPSTKNETRPKVDCYSLFDFLLLWNNERKLDPGRCFFITSNDRPFGCPISCIDIYSQCYFVHWHLQQCLIQSSSLANQNAIFVINF